MMIVIIGGVLLSEVERPLAHAICHGGGDTIAVTGAELDMYGSSAALDDLHAGEQLRAGGQWMARVVAALLAVLQVFHERAVRFI